MSTTVRDLRRRHAVEHALLPTEERPSTQAWIDRLGLGNKAVLTIDEAAAVLRVSDRTVRERIKDGQLPALRLGRRVVVPVPRLVSMLVEPLDREE